MSLKGIGLSPERGIPEELLGVQLYLRGILIFTTLTLTLTLTLNLTLPREASSRWRRMHL